MADTTSAAVVLIVVATLTAGRTGVVGTQGLDAERPPACEDVRSEPPDLLVEERDRLSTYRWNASEASYEPGAQARGLAEPLWAHGRIYALGERGLVL